MSEGKSLRIKRPWEPVDGESAGAYAAFCLYKDFGIGRSLKDVERALEQMPGSKVGYHTLLEWSSKFDWEGRILKWDAEVTRVRHEAETREQKRHAVRLLQEKRQRASDNLILASGMKHKVAEMLQYPISRTISETVTEVKDNNGNTISQIVVKIIEPNKWGVRDAAILIGKAFEIEKACLFEDDAEARAEAHDEVLADAEARLHQFRAAQLPRIESIPLMPPPPAEAVEAD